jgi:hypothetical protein
MTKFEGYFIENGGARFSHNQCASPQMARRPKFLMTGIEAPCYLCKMSALKGKDALAGLSAEELRIMQRLLQSPPEPHKAAPKPVTWQAEAQRRRREKERNHSSSSKEARQKYQPEKTG